MNEENVARNNSESLCKKYIIEVLSNIHDKDIAVPQDEIMRIISEEYKHTFNKSTVSRQIRKLPEICEYNNTFYRFRQIEMIGANCGKKRPHFYFENFSVDYSELIDELRDKTNYFYNRYAIAIEDDESYVVGYRIASNKGEELKKIIKKQTKNNPKYYRNIGQEIIRIFYSKRTLYIVADKKCPHLRDFVDILDMLLETNYQRDKLPTAIYKRKNNKHNAE